MGRQPTHNLSPLQLQVIRLVLAGRSAKQTAETLGITCAAVYNAQAKARTKFGAKNRLELIQTLQNEGIIGKTLASPGDQQ